MLLRILHLELVGFVYALTGAVVFQLLTRRINLQGCFLRKDGSGEVSPERIQLLLATMMTSADFLGEVAKSNTGHMPDVSSGWLYVFGGSSTIYAVGKAWSLWSGKNKDG